MQSDHYEVVDHTADWSLRIMGRDLPQLLKHAAEGMSSLLVSDIHLIPTDVERRIGLDAYDSEDLLVEWLTELAYMAESEQLVFREFNLTYVTGTQLKAIIKGGRAPELVKHIKAVTYHNLQIIETADGLEATVVFDV